MNLIQVLVMGLILIGCSSVHKIEKNRYFVECPHFYSVKSCAKKGLEKCPKGLKVTNSDSSWSFFSGAKTRVFVQCK